MLVLATTLCATSLPFAYNWTRFPSAWFGANKTHWESDAQLAEIGRYSMAVLGWQHLDDVTNWTAVVYAQLAEAGRIKAAHPDVPVFVYCGFGWAMGLNAAVQPLMFGPDKEQYTNFFLQAADGPEFTHTDCQQMGENPPNCVGWFWNFGNASARDYFVDHLVGPLAAAGTIDGVFFDAVNYGYDIPETRPWGRAVVSVPDCDGRLNVSGCDALVAGTIDVAARATKLLNANGKVPIFANPGYYSNFYNRTIVLDEQRLVTALDGLEWLNYYESARAEQLAADPKVGDALLRNMLREGRAGVPVGVHAYYARNATTGALEDVTPHVAAFLLAREEHWYYFGSTGWFDASYEWSDLYDLECGRPKGAATSVGAVWSREYDRCQVHLDCSAAVAAGAGGCEASIVGPGAARTRRIS